MIAEILKSHYESPNLLEYSESDDEIRFQLRAPLRDPQAAAFRSRATVLNELALSHRLSLLAGRAKYQLPEDYSFAIKSIESASHNIDRVHEYDVFLRFEVLTKRKDTITALRSTLVTKYDFEARSTVTSFNVLPPALANFIRRGRNFQDFSDVKMSRDESCLAPVAENHFRYYPSENDRISDGRRVDHVPALTLIDIALSIDGVAHDKEICSNISAEFLNYTDPRVEIDIFYKEDDALEFVQNGQVVATVQMSTNVPIPLY